MGWDVKISIGRRKEKKKRKKKIGHGRNRTLLLSLQVKVVSNDNMRLYLRECATITPHGLMCYQYVYIFIVIWE